MIKLNIDAMKSDGLSIARGEYREESSPMVIVLKETRAWCKLHQAQMDSKAQPEAPSRFEGYRVESAFGRFDVGCSDIEGLVRQIVEQ